MAAAVVASAVGIVTCAPQHDETVARQSDLSRVCLSSSCAVPCAIQTWIPGISFLSTMVINCLRRDLPHNKRSAEQNVDDGVPTS